jgi:hypothetical protein
MNNGSRGTGTGELRIPIENVVIWLCRKNTFLF